MLPCACPRPVHAACLARWQLHSAGTPEETSCRFCQGQLPDWKGVLTPAEVRHAGWEESEDGGAAETTSPGGETPPAPSASSSPPRLHPRLRHPAPTMSVTFNGVVHHIVVRGGPNGYAAFVSDVRRIFHIDAGHDMQLAFDCADPVTGALVKLNGAGAYQAAVHCAAISAAKRMATWARAQREREQEEQRARHGVEGGAEAEATEAALALASGGATEDDEGEMMEEDGEGLPSSVPETPTSHGSGTPSDASSAALDAAIESALAAAAFTNGDGNGSGNGEGSHSPTSASSPPQPQQQQQQQQLATAASTRVTRRSAAAAAAAQQAAAAAQAALAAGASATAAPGDLRRALAEIAGGVRRLRAAAAAAVGAGGAGGNGGDDGGDAASTAAALREVADLIASTAEAATLQQQQALW